VWVASVDNIDWPSKRGLPVDQQRRELITILDTAARVGLNAVLLQVRPACDALYPSSLEPWSEYLTGEMGKSPTALWDPLATAVEEAHARGIELHAWLNPYRARHPTGKSALSADHIARRRPELVRTYGKHLWLDPGEPGVQDHSLAVVLDIVRRYDVDGVHLDDYFYPYPERDSANRVIPFPDDVSWKRYQQGGGGLTRDDWRRENVNRFIERLYREVKAAKRWVKVGISPFGIWRPGNPPQIQGFDQFAQLYADARKWLVNGWLDYAAPQLYWRIDPPAQSYPVLLKWWVEQNPAGRHLWPGNFTSNLTAAGWSAAEIANQIRLTRAQTGAGGNIHFSARPLLKNQAGITDALATGPYRTPALVPASPWLGSEPPNRPELWVRNGPGLGERSLRWKAAEGPAPRLWALRLFVGGRWQFEIHPVGRSERALLPVGSPNAPTIAVLSAVDRLGNESPTAVVEFGSAPNRIG
jgi:uncharacterized lipoprotein YddW (UPF0748 family)